MAITPVETQTRPYPRPPVATGSTTMTTARWTTRATPVAQAPMMMTKRSLGASDPAQAKRSKVTSIERLCDLRGAVDVFANTLNASRARERGYLRSRDASGKYEEV